MNLSHHPATEYQKGLDDRAKCTHTHMPQPIDDVILFSRSNKRHWVPIGKCVQSKKTSTYSSMRSANLFRHRVLCADANALHPPLNAASACRTARFTSSGPLTSTFLDTIVFSWGVLKMNTSLVLGFTYLPFQTLIAFIIQGRC